MRCRLIVLPSRVGLGEMSGARTPLGLAQLGVARELLTINVPGPRRTPREPPVKVRL
jgi:hypothetical protein